MKSKKLISIFLITVSVLCLAAAIVLLILAAQNLGYKKILHIIVGVLLLLLSMLIMLYWGISRKDDKNFFLYDGITERNLPPEQLTQQKVLERMTYFIDELADSPEMLWSGNVLEWNSKFGHRGIFKPLVAYKMLYDLGLQDPNSSYWNYLANASDESLGIICASLERAGEKKIVRAFRLILESEPKPGPQMKEFLNKNTGYISSRMLNYVKMNIDCFY
ncbi:MAG: hypothetical protein E7680_06670 [Ruminococcaceae bacterium]|nr:hypothetical protein [Oscillospiraceae bacterium]